MLNDAELIWVNCLLFILCDCEFCLGCFQMIMGVETGQQLYRSFWNWNKIIRWLAALSSVAVLLHHKHFCGVQEEIFLSEEAGRILQKNKSLSFSLRMIGSLRCNLRDNREQAECIMHYNHRQEEGRVKRGQANVVICFVQSLQLGIFYMMQLNGEGGGMKKLEECRWITVWNTQETLRNNTKQ